MMVSKVFFCFHPYFHLAEMIQISLRVFFQPSTPKACPWNITISKEKYRLPVGSFFKGELVVFSVNYGPAKSGSLVKEFRFISRKSADVF